MSRRKPQSIQDKAFRALRKAVRDLVKTRAINGEKVVVLKNGKVAHVPAAKLI